MPLFLPIAVAAIAGDAVAGEANLGTLRYLLAVPVDRTRLLVVKFGGDGGVRTGRHAAGGDGRRAVRAWPCSAAARWSRCPARRCRSGPACCRLLLVVVYVTVCLTALGAIGLFVSTLTEQPIGATIAILILALGSEIADAIPQLSVIHRYLPTHYWTGLRRPAARPDQLRPDHCPAWRPPPCTCSSSVPPRGPASAAATSPAERRTPGRGTRLARCVPGALATRPIERDQRGAEEFGKRHVGSVVGGQVLAQLPDAVGQPGVGIEVHRKGEQVGMGQRGWLASSVPASTWRRRTALTSKGMSSGADRRRPRTTPTAHWPSGPASASRATAADASSTTPGDALPVIAGRRRGRRGSARRSSLVPGPATRDAGPRDDLLQRGLGRELGELSQQELLQRPSGAGGPGGQLVPNLVGHVRMVMRPSCLPM